MEAAAGAEFVRRLRGLIEPDPQLQRDGLAYLDSLKASDTGWQLCVDALLSASLDAEEHVQFYCLQAVEHFVKTRYAAEAATAAPVTRHFVSGWVQRQVRYTFLDACLKKKTKSISNRTNAIWRAFHCYLLFLVYIAGKKVQRDKPSGGGSNHNIVRYRCSQGFGWAVRGAPSLRLSPFIVL